MKFCWADKIKPRPKGDLAAPEGPCFGEKHGAPAGVNPLEDVSFAVEGYRLFGLVPMEGDQNLSQRIHLSGHKNTSVWQRVGDFDNSIAVLEVHAFEEDASGDVREFILVATINKETRGCRGISEHPPMPAQVPGSEPRAPAYTDILLVPLVEMHKTPRESIGIGGNFDFVWNKVEGEFVDDPLDTGDFAVRCNLHPDLPPSK